MRIPYSSLVQADAMRQVYDLVFLNLLFSGPQGNVDLDRLGLLRTLRWQGIAPPRRQTCSTVSYHTI